VGESAGNDRDLHRDVRGSEALAQHVLLRERPDLDVSFASDGDAAQWCYLEGIAAALPNPELRTTTFNLDFWHAASYVDSAAKAAFDTEDDAKVQAEQWKASLKEHVHGASRVLKSMRYFRDQQVGGRYEAMDASIAYLAKRLPRDE